MEAMSHDPCPVGDGRPSVTSRQAQRLAETWAFGLEQLGVALPLKERVPLLDLLIDDAIRAVWVH
jgi:hypothetical protein